MDVSEYEAQADIIDVNDIANNSNNRIVMRRIKRNNANDDNYKELWIQNQHDDDECYCPEGADDMGWLGYFVGKNSQLKKLYIEPFEPPDGAGVRDVMEPFFRGISSNKSIREIYFSNMDLEGEVFTMLGSFFKNNYNLINIDVNNCDFRDEGARLFALAIGSCTHKSLREVKLEDNDISEEGMVEIITALSMYPRLEHLDLEANHLRKKGCVALATLLQYSAAKLRRLFISNCDIGDEGIEALAPALSKCNQVRILYLSNNPSITTRGWKSLASILESPNCNLTSLDVDENNVDDDAVASFANASMNNHKLQTLNLDSNPSITAVACQSFSKILCDTSSINATFLSNHTLVSLGEEELENAIIGSLLDLNERDDKKEVATIKILQSHSDFDMLPFFEWEFKVLPLVISWLERASACRMPRGFEPNIEPRKLSTIYQFVRGMPVLYVEIHLRQELEDIKAREKQMEEQQTSFQQEFMQQMQFLQERKMIIMRKLGQPVPK